MKIYLVSMKKNVAIYTEVTDDVAKTFKHLLTSNDDEKKKK